MSTCKSMNDQPAILHWGLAKASRDPVVLLCTSGTAASNYHPAITEAYYARVPLVVITADRPHELREVGAPQAIDQIRMYGQHVKYSVDFPLAEKNPDIDDFIDRQISRALAVATSIPWVSVHLNVPFREPLLIDFDRATPVSTFNKRLAGTTVLDTIHRGTCEEAPPRCRKRFNHCR